MTVNRQYALEHFEELCDRAEHGEEIVLERPGHASIALIPKPRFAQQSAHDAIEAIRESMRDRPPLQGVTIRELIDEGRRY